MDLDRALSWSGPLPPEAGVFTGRAGAVDRGSVVEIQLRVSAGRVAEASYLAFGAPDLYACAAAACEAATGLALDEARSLTGLAVGERAGLEPQSLGLALIVEDALKAALARAIG